MDWTKERMPTIPQRRRIALDRGTYHDNGDGSLFCRLCWSTFIPSTPCLSDPKGLKPHEAANRWMHSGVR